MDDRLFDLGCIAVLRSTGSIRFSFRDILYEDDHYIAVNKRKGWPVHKTVDPLRPDVYRAVKSYLRRRDNGREVYLALHHRLDVSTTGVLLFSKSARANVVLANVFRERSAVKVYEAICLSGPSALSGELSNFLKEKKVRGMTRMVEVMAGGLKTITKYKQIEKIGDLARMRFELVTGRMHQIRAQTSLAGFPILGDDMYGNKNRNKQFGADGVLLHAKSFRFFDPLSAEEKIFQAPLPECFLRENLRDGQAESASTRQGIAGRDRGQYQYLLFHKPYNVLCQFTPNRPGERCLGDFGLPDHVYPVGRLDKDSEGLLVLTDDGQANHRLSHSKYCREKTYWVQVEGVPNTAALDSLRLGVSIKKHQCRPCQVRRLGSEMNLPDRIPPIRVRRNIPTCWLELILTEGKNRQVRRMTAAVGYPTLRLVRVQVGGFHLSDLRAGEFINVASLP